MRGIRAVVLALGCLVLAGCAHNAVEAPKPQSPEVLAFVWRPWGADDFAMHFSKFDERHHRLLKNGFSVNFGYLSRGHEMATILGLAPGTYVTRSVTSRQSWTACFNENALAFDVKPGAILYLGKVDMTAQLEFIQKEAEAAGETKTDGKTAFGYFERVPPPSLTYPRGEDEQLGNIRKFLAESQPSEDLSRVQLANYRQTHFSTGKDALGQRICAAH